MAKLPPEDAPSAHKAEPDTKLSLFRKLPAFKGITVEALNTLFESASNRFVVRGDYVFKQDDPASSLVIFNKGLAVEFKRSGRMDCLLSYYEEPAVLGESGFLENCCRSTSLYANEDCWVTEIDNKQLWELYEKSPDQFETLYSNIGREMGKKASAINEKLHQAGEYSFIRETSLNWDQYE